MNPQENIPPVIDYTNYSLKPDTSFWNSFSEASIIDIREKIRAVPKLEEAYIVAKKGLEEIGLKRCHRAWVIEKMRQNLDTGTKHDHNSPLRKLEDILGYKKLHQF